jgi:hypothetical protein
MLCPLPGTPRAPFPEVSAVRDWVSDTRFPLARGPTGFLLTIQNSTNMSAQNLKRSSTDSSGNASKRACVSTNFGGPDPTTWTFTPKTSPTGTTAYISDAAGKKIRLQLPRMRVPFGFREAGKMVAGAWVENTEGTSRPSLELDVASPEVLEWGKRVDKAVVKYIADNSVSLLKRELSEEFVSQIFRGVIPEARDDYNPLMRTKITKSGTYSTKVRVVVDPGSATTPLCHKEGVFEDIARNDEVVPIVDVTGVWFANNSAGMTLGLAYVLVYKDSVDDGNVFNIPGVAGVESVKVAPEPETPDVEVEADPFA